MPGSADIPLVIDAVTSVALSLEPAPVAAAPFTVPAGWRDLTEDQLDGIDASWAIPHLLELAAMEQRWADTASGTSLVHNDTRLDNLLIQPDGQVSVVDWAQTRLGWYWRDTYSLAPHLVMAGHTPAQAEALLLDGTLLTKADPDLVTANAAALAGYLIRSAPLPPPPNVPHLRPYQARAANAVAALVRHRTGW